MIKKALSLFDKYFWNIFSISLFVLLGTVTFIFVFQVPFICLELDNETLFLADEEDKPKKCFHYYSEWKAHNEYLELKYHTKNESENYFIDRLNTSSDVDWLN